MCASEESEHETRLWITAQFNIEVEMVRWFIRIARWMNVIPVIVYRSLPLLLEASTMRYNEKSLWCITLPISHRKMWTYLLAFTSHAAPARQWGTLITVAWRVITCTSKQLMAQLALAKADLRVGWLQKWMKKSLNTEFGIVNGDSRDLTVCEGSRRVDWVDESVFGPRQFKSPGTRTR